MSQSEAGFDYFVIAASCGGSASICLGVVGIRRVAEMQS